MNTEYYYLSSKEKKDKIQPNSNFKMNPEMEIERLRNLVNRLEKDLNCKGINMEFRVKLEYIHI